MLPLVHFLSQSEHDIWDTSFSSYYLCGGFPSKSDRCLSFPSHDKPALRDAINDHEDMITTVVSGPSGVSAQSPRNSFMKCVNSLSVRWGHFYKRSERCRSTSVKDTTTGEFLQEVYLSSRQKASDMTSKFGNQKVGRMRGAVDSMFMSILTEHEEDK